MKTSELTFALGPLGQFARVVAFGQVVTNLFAKYYVADTPPHVDKLLVTLTGLRLLIADDPSKPDLGQLDCITL